MIAEPTQPTFYFIGVTTAQSSIMRIFPRWAAILGLDTQIAGYDAPLHAPAEVYRAIVTHIKTHPLARGGLVTTHKIDLLDAARDLFDELDSYAVLCGEVSAIAKRDGALIGKAKDPVTSGIAWRTFVPDDHFARTGGEVLCFGSGGAAVAISVYLASTTDRPTHMTLVDISQSRLDHARAIHARISTDVKFDYILNDHAVLNDARMGRLLPGSVVINATGMGKDLPGSPVTDDALFPQNGFAWELNYRGELAFAQHARRQSEARGLHVEDGWVYFLHGWAQAMADVLAFDLTPEVFAQLDTAAREVR
jgi:shikimate 5-dehydrogenase